MFNKMSGPSNSSDIGSNDAASTSVDAGVSQGIGLAEDLDKKPNAIQQVLQMLMDTPGRVEAVAEVLNEPDCPVIIKDGHFIEKNDTFVEESLNCMDIKTKIRNLKDDEILTLTQHDIPDFPYLKIKKNPKFDNMFILWNENANGEVINKVNFSSFNNTAYWAEKCDDMFEDQPKEVNESMENKNYMSSDEINLEYTDLPIVVYEGGSSTGRFDADYGNWLPDEGVEKKIEVDYTYTITKTEAFEVIRDLIVENPLEETKDMTEEQLDTYIEDNFNDLFDKFEDQIKDHFADAAAEEAQDRDYLYESAPTKDYFDRKYEEVEDVELRDFWDDVKEEPAIEEDYDLIDTNLELEGLDANDPEVKVTDYDWDEEDLEAASAEWEEVASKSVFDSDGFLTDYVWYTNGDKHVFVFGDSDRYRPEDGDFDWEIDIVKGKEAEGYKEAQDWFNSYKGFEDEDLDLEFADLDDPNSEDITFNDDVDQDPQVDENKSLNESVMSDLDLDVKELGGSDALIERIEKHIAALQSELSFLSDIAPREIGAGGNFDSQKEVDEAIRATEEQLHKEQAKLSVLRRGK